MDLIVYDLNDKYENDSCEGSGWPLQSLSQCIVQCAATHKLMIKRKKEKWYKNKWNGHMRNIHIWAM